MYFAEEETAPKKAMATLSFPKREKIYRRQEELESYTQDSKANFISAFAWCVHAEIPKACRNAANLINRDTDSFDFSTHSSFFGSKVSKIDGSKQKAAVAKASLLTRAEQLEKQAQKAEQKNTKKDFNRQTREHQRMRPR